MRHLLILAGLVVAASSMSISGDDELLAEVTDNTLKRLALYSATKPQGRELGVKNKVCKDTDAKCPCELCENGSTCKEKTGDYGMKCTGPMCNKKSGEAWGIFCNVTFPKGSCKQACKALLAEEGNGKAYAGCLKHSTTKSGMFCYDTAGGMSGINRRELDDMFGQGSANTYALMFEEEYRKLHKKREMEEESTLVSLLKQLLEK